MKYLYIVLLLTGCAVGPQPETLPPKDMLSMPYIPPTQRIKYERVSTKVCGTVGAGVVRVRACKEGEKT